MFMDKTLHIHHENVHEQDIAYSSKSNHKCRPTVLYLYMCSAYTLANYIIYYFINFPLANVDIYNYSEHNNQNTNISMIGPTNIIITLIGSII